MAVYVMGQPGADRLRQRWVEVVEGGEMLVGGLDGVSGCVEGLWVSRIRRLMVNGVTVKRRAMATCGSPTGGGEGWPGAGRRG